MHSRVHEPVLLNTVKEFEDISARSITQEAAWSSYINGTASTEESEVMAHLLGPFTLGNEQGHGHHGSYGVNSMCWASDHANGSSENVNGSFSAYYWTQGDDSSSSGFLAPSSGYESYYLNDLNEVPTNNNSAYSMAGEEYVSSFLRLIPNPPFGDPTGMNEETSSDDVEDFNMNAAETNDSEHQILKQKRKPCILEDVCFEAPKKKTRYSANVPKSVKKTQSKKSYKNRYEEESNAGTKGPNSCSYSSEDDSQEHNGGGSTSCSSKDTPPANPIGKTRAGRGSATDPQSLYARKRRERINERLKVLQHLVPNGTKVDISTMLEEAVRYVKFLQVQIKLLSSDDLWMYAPIAYNGMNIGLDLKISPP